MRSFVVLCLLTVASADKLGYNYKPVSHSDSGLSFIPGNIGGSSLHGGSFSSGSIGGGSLGGGSQGSGSLGVGNVGVGSFGNSHPGAANLGGGSIGNDKLSGSSAVSSSLGSSFGFGSLSSGDTSSSNLGSGSLGDGSLVGGSFGSGSFGGGNFNGGSLSGGNLNVGSLRGGNINGGSPGGSSLGIGSLGDSNLSGGIPGDGNISGGDLSGIGDFGGKTGGSSYSPAPSVELEKEFYTFSAPEDEYDNTKDAQRTVDSVKKGIRVIFIKSPENKGLENAAISLAKQASEQKTAIYVLSKQTDIGDLTHRLQSLNINVNRKPEVHFVKYRTPEDAAYAQKAIQDQYESLGGSSQSHDGGVAPILNFVSPALTSTSNLKAPDNAYLPSSAIRHV